MDKNKIRLFILEQLDTNEMEKMNKLYREDAKFRQCVDDFDMGTEFGQKFQKSDQALKLMLQNTPNLFIKVPRHPQTKYSRLKNSVIPIAASILIMLFFRTFNDFWANERESLEQQFCKTQRGIQDNHYRDIPKLDNEEDIVQEFKTRCTTIGYPMLIKEYELNPTKNNLFKLLTVLGKKTGEPIKCEF